MKKILILGGTGMAGHVVYYYLSSLQKYKIFNACFRNKLTEDSFIINVRDESKITDLINKVKPDVVINCIGILIRGAKESVENCIYINSYLPHSLSRILHETVPNSKLIHISTDCVFSGEKGNYSDLDEKDALDVYGMSKNLGEVINNQDLTLRTSIIGPELKANGEGLFHWIFSQIKIGSLNGFDKSIWGGVTTLELAKVIEKVLESDLTGLYQISNNQPISKLSLVSLIVKEFTLPIKVNKVDGVVCDKSIINSQNQAFSYEVSSYEKMIKELHTYMNKHKELYAQYEVHYEK